MRNPANEADADVDTYEKVTRDRESNQQTTTATIGNAIPCQGGTYMIIETTSGRAISLSGALVGGSRPTLLSTSEGLAAKKHWYCVEKDGYLGFQNPKSGKFLGHDGNWKGGGKADIRAEATMLHEWEFFTVRPHPQGGYQLLLPQSPFRLNVLSIAEDGKQLEARHHGATTFRFVSV
jgi:hypothetical protein